MTETKKRGRRTLRGFTQHDPLHAQAGDGSCHDHEEGADEQRNPRSHCGVEGSTSTNRDGDPRMRPLPRFGGVSIFRNGREALRVVNADLKCLKTMT